MRKSLLMIAGLTGAAFLLRRSRRFGPASVMIAGTLIDQVLGALRNQDGAKVPTKPSFWTKLTIPKPPAPQEE